MSTYSKIAQYSCSIYTNQNVSCFNISMNLLFRMKILQTIYNLLQNIGQYFLVLDSLYKMMMQYLLNGPTINKWHHKPNICFVDKGHIETHQIFMMCFRHNFDLPSNFFDIVTTKKSYINYFDSYLFLEVF